MVDRRRSLHREALDAPSRLAGDPDGQRVRGDERGDRWDCVPAALLARVQVAPGAVEGGGEEARAEGKIRVTALDPDLLLRAYTIGVFPMSDSRDAESVFWVEPKRRAILPLDSFHLSKSLRKLLRSEAFAVTRDRAFDRIVGLCAARPETWINADIEAAYGRLHRAGCAHSIEVWEDGELAGGLYGVAPRRRLLRRIRWSRCARMRPRSRWPGSSPGYASAASACSIASS